MVDKYEISLWEDFPDVTSNGTPFLNEQKLCVIGSNTMQSQVRALEPKMVTNINGTNTFTFKMYYRYIDEQTGEFYTNPFANLLINERKVKVYWKDKWYDMLIKNIDEDTSSKSITYTCKDLFITELSRNGYNLEFSSDLQNNIGTASELAAAVLKDSGWQFNSTDSTKIIQKTEEPVYEVTPLVNFEATKQSPDGDSSDIIIANKTILVFYSSIIGINTIDERTVDIQFLYNYDGYSTDENDMLVTNSDCYTAKFTAYQSGGYVYLLNNDTIIAIINTTIGISTRYRGKRLVKTQLTKYDKLFNKYVNVYHDLENNNKEVWGYSKIEFSDPLSVNNFIANPSDFKNTDGWIGNNITWGIYPKFTNNSNISDYKAKSYLKINQGEVYNSGLKANSAFLKPSQGDIKQGNTGGFHVGDQYIFRIKMKENGLDPSSTDYKFDNIINPSICQYNDKYQSYGDNYFSVEEPIINGNWLEYSMTCITSIPADKIEQVGLFLYSQASIWIEEVQFFKYTVGVTSYEDNTEQRINPGEISLQGLSKTVYRYYNADHDGVNTAEELVFLYEGEEQPDRFVIQTNNYEKMTSIEAKGSNRFNILQSIAENFECWLRFNINHDETGKVKFDSDGLPQKYVSLVEQIGHDTGISFEYGIDLQGIKRTIVSNTIATKAIIIPNENQFGKNGFCTIARSNLNYTKENFILNLDYFINQNLLDQDMLNRDLYSSSDNYIGYYYFLHKYNTEYDEITELLINKKTEFTKQNSQLTVLENQQKATLEKIDSNKSDIMMLACVTNWNDAQIYVSTHADNVKVQSLMNSIAQLQNTYNKNAVQLADLRSSLSKLENYITTKTERQRIIAQNTEDLHTRFFKKYARFLQEGTWQDSNYYLDAVDVAYTSSRPQLQYDINVMRLSALDDFTSKVFDVGDICYIQDREYFGYIKDGITPFKLKIIISEITSYFNSPEKDVIKVQNYKTQFDDLFQRITATTQNLQYQSGGFQKAADVINHDKTLSFDLLQDTFDYNENWVLNASNQHVTWDSTGITVTDDNDAALQLRIMAGGLFISNDGGATWKNAIRGDGISTDILTAGRINTSEIFVYDGNHPSFRWDSAGINAYFSEDEYSADFGKYVRFDRFGLYGYQGEDDFVPSTEEAIWDPDSNVKFGLTWKGFFLRGENGGSSLEISDDGEGIVFKMLNSIGDNSLEISTSEDIVLKTGDVKRVQIGRLTPTDQNTEYGIWVRDGGGDNIFNVSSAGTNSIGGWNLTKDSFYHTDGLGTIGLFANGKNWTILSPNSTNADLNKIGNAQAGTGRPTYGDTHDYYIIAGNKFGVTIDGEIYSAGGRIGGWTINNSTLTGGNITIDSAGNMSCTVNGTLQWKLDNNGLGTFHNIFADIGYIAGWHIEPESIWNDSGTSLNSNLSGSYHIDKYTIVTDSIKASGGSIGGCTVGSNSISGGNWSLGPSGGLIGGWSITSNSIKGSNIELFSSGSININGATITGYGGGGVSFSSVIYSYGAIMAAGNLSTSGVLSIAGSGDTYTTLDYTHCNYLHWLYSNWGNVTPNQVRVAGVNSVWVSGLAVSTRYVSGQYYRVVGDEAWVYITTTVNLTGTNLEGNSITPVNSPYSQNMTLDISSVYSKGKNDGYNNGYNTGWNNGYNRGYSDANNYGYVWLQYSYDPDGYVDGVRARCTRCGSSGWWWL